MHHNILAVELSPVDIFGLELHVLFVMLRGSGFSGCFGTLALAS